MPSSFSEGQVGDLPDHLGHICVSGWQLGSRSRIEVVCVSPIRAQASGYSDNTLPFLGHFQATPSLGTGAECAPAPAQQPLRKAPFPLPHISLHLSSFHPLL